MSTDAVYVVAWGSVEFRRSDHPPVQGPPASSGAKPPPFTPRSYVKGKVRPSGSLVTGGVFGSLPVGGPEPFTVVATSSPCEVWCACGHDWSKLPVGIRE